MKMKGMTLAIFALGLIMLSVTSCEKNGDTSEKAVEVSNSFAIPTKSQHFSFYSLKDGKEILLSDSATTKWDFGIRFTTIILNSHASGPGQGGVIVKTGSYDDFVSAPVSGYAYDTSATSLAIGYNPGSPDAWYIYQPTDHKVVSKAGLFFVLKTAEGKYAKMEIPEVTYAGWDGNPMNFPDTLVYKFRYLYQPDGSTNLTEN